MVSIIILFVLLFGFLMGLRRGFVLQLVHLVGFIVSYIMAAIFYKKFAGQLSMWIPYPDLPDDSAWGIFLSTMPLENAFYNAVSFAVIFFGSKIILQTIAYMFDFIARIPVLRSVNKLLGAMLGFVEVYVITFVVLFLIALLPLGAVQEKVGNSFMAKLIVQHTPILSSFTESILFTDTLSQLFQ